MAALRGLAVLVVATCLWNLATANDHYHRATVLDCDKLPVRDAYVSVYGCTDKAGSSEVSTTAAESKVIEAIDPVTAYAGPLITETMYCPDEWGVPQDNGLKVDYCSGSALNDCSLAVVKFNPATNKYDLHPDYEPMVNVYKMSLQNYTLNTLDPANASKYLYETIPRQDFGTLGGDKLWCPSPFPVCSRRVFEFLPKDGKCTPPPSPPSPTVCTDKCPGMDKVYGSCKPMMVPYGETGYAVMCELDKNGSDGPSSLTHPTFVSFNSKQPIYPSNPGLFSSMHPSNWGWMGQWPNTHLAGGDENCCTVSGNIYAGRKYLAGTVRAFMKAYPPPAGADPYTKQYSLTVSINGYPNRLRELHIYFGCTPLYTNAPGQFGNIWTTLNGVQQLTKTVSAVCSEAPGKMLYTAIHTVFN